MGIRLTEMISKPFGTEVAALAARASRVPPRRPARASTARTRAVAARTCGRQGRTI